VFHVPRNEALGRVRPGDPGADAHWRRYLAAWTAGNHVRALAGIAAAAALTVAVTAGSHSVAGWGARAAGTSAPSRRSSAALRARPPT
jgi:hypothetical protein